MPIYATPTQLARFITANPDATAEDGPANAPALLRFASLLMGEATKQKLYATDSEGLPTDSKFMLAFRDATCAQAATYAALSIDPIKGSAGFAANVSSKALGAAQVAYSNDSEREAVKSRLADGRTLTMEAYLTLKQAGLITSAVLSDGGDGRVYSAPPWPVQ